MGGNDGRQCRSFLVLTAAVIPFSPAGNVAPLEAARFP